MQYEEFAKLWAPLMGISVNEGEAEAAETTDEAEEAQDVGDGSPPASLQRSIGDNGSKSSGLGSSRTGLSFADKISQSFKRSFKKQRPPSAMATVDEEAEGGGGTPTAVTSALKKSGGSKASGGSKGGKSGSKSAAFSNSFKRGGKGSSSSSAAAQGSHPPRPLKRGLSRSVLSRAAGLSAFPKVSIRLLGRLINLMHAISHAPQPCPPLSPAHPNSPLLTPAHPCSPLTSPHPVTRLLPSLPLRRTTSQLCSPRRS